MTQQEIETALANGELWAQMSSGRFWRARRNGKTQTWKTRAGEFRIPIKCGLKACGEVTHNSDVAMVGHARWRAADFAVSEGDPNNAL